MMSSHLSLVLNGAIVIFLVNVVIYLLRGAILLVVDR